MSVAFFIVTEREVAGLDTFVDGKAIAHVPDKALHKLCRAAGVKPVDAFISMDPDELADFLDDEGADAPDELPPAQWFAPDEGLAWTRQLMAHLQANPAALPDTAGVLADLAEYETVFQGLQQHGVRWHFQVDF